MYGLKYSRALHEQIEKGLIAKLKRGQPVPGKFTKQKGDGKNGKQGEKGKGKDGDGSESQEQDWEFHELLPSEIHSKPTG